MISNCNSKVIGLTNNQNFGLYLHVPFCVHKCSYCDFYSFTKYDESDFGVWCEKIVREIEAAAIWLKDQDKRVSPLRSIFFGGGTPSLIPVSYLEKIFSVVFRSFSLKSNCEITLEANPETLSIEYAKSLKNNTSINRISLGAQSFDAAHLKTLERIGGVESIRRAAEICRTSGFENFNLDLIFGIPKQSLDQVENELKAAIQERPRHISFYQLTLTPGHPQYSQLPDEDLTADMYEVGQALLSRSGYEQYEISNFSQKGFECEHNLLYWDGGDFLGVGPSASSRFFWRGRFHHRKQVADFKKYLESAVFPAPGFEETNEKQTILEATFLELRKNKGVDRESFKARYGYDLEAARNFGLFLRQGLLITNDGTIALTKKGLMLADRVTRDLVD